MSDDSLDEYEVEAMAFQKEVVARSGNFCEVSTWRHDLEMDEDLDTTWWTDYQDWEAHALDPFDDAMDADDEAFEDDDDDPQRVSEYAADIFGRLGQDEASHRLPQPSYMKTQPDLDAPARASTVDWLVSVQMKYRLKTETLFLAVSIMDRFLATKRIKRKDLQLVACTAAFIAAKFEEIHPPDVRDFVYITDQLCRKDAILFMEVTMLTALEFCLCRPTAAHYLERYQREGHCGDGHRFLLQYILELALLDLGMTRFSPSTQAGAASLVSCKILKLDPVWHTDVGERSKRSENAVQRCAGEMVTMLQDAEQSPFQAVRQKFSKAEFQSVATIPLVNIELIADQPVLTAFSS